MSRLYRIVPSGIDTIDVIALTDYIILLANEHQVPVYALVEQEIIPTINSVLGDLERPVMSHLRANESYAINGSPSSPKWSTALERLTLQHNLKQLTTATLQGMIPAHSRFNLNKKWCDLCYDEARANGTLVYDRLIWKFHSVCVCNHHQRTLREQCPFHDCQKK